MPLLIGGGIISLVERGFHYLVYRLLSNYIKTRSPTVREASGLF